MKILKKTRKKAGMIFSANINRRKTNPLIYVKYWKQVCLPSLIFGSEIFSLTSTLLSRLEHCQRRFLKIVFHVPKFASSILIERLGCVNSVESEIEYRKLLFIGRLLSVPNIPITVKTLFRTRIERFYDEKISSIGVFSTIFEALSKHDLPVYLEERRKTAIFPTYSVWKNLVKECIILFEKNRWSDHCLNHPNMEISRLSRPCEAPASASAFDSKLRLEWWCSLASRNQRRTLLLL